MFYHFSSFFFFIFSLLFRRIICRRSPRGFLVILTYKWRSQQGLTANGIVVKTVNLRSRDPGVCVSALDPFFNFTKLR